MRTTDKLPHMFSRVMTVAIACWAFVGSPALCTAGLIQHLCKPHAEAVGAPAPCANLACHCERSSNCSHESDCTADPCHQILAARDAAAPRTEAATTFAVIVAAMADLHTDACQGCSVAVKRDSSRTRLCLPLHPSELPLLI